MAALPRFLPTLVAAVVAAGLVARAAHDLRSFVETPAVSFLGPGEFHYPAPVASTYTLWHAATTTIDGTFTINESRLPAGTRIAVTHAGRTVDTVPDGSTTTTGSESGQKVSVLRFKAGEPGDYLITVSGFSEKRRFVVTEGYGIGPLFGAIGWMFGAALGVVATVLILIVALAGVFPRRRSGVPPAAIAANPGAAEPPLL